ncbi:MAG: hypothetical protein ABIL68_13535, partial [bacterium]
DIFIVNKSDREGADRLVVEIDMMLGMRTQENSWRPKVVKTVATVGDGIDRLVEYIFEHHTYLESNQLLAEHHEENVRTEIAKLVDKKLCESFWMNRLSQELHNHLITEVCEGRMSPNEAARNIVERFSHR